MSRAARAPAVPHRALALGALAACSGPTPAAPTSPAPNGSVALAASFDGAHSCGGPGVAAVVVDPPAIDPTSSAAAVQVTVTVRGLDAFPTAMAVHAVQPVHIGLFQGDAEVATLADVAQTLPGDTVRARWDGRLHDAPAPRGTYTVRVRYGCDATTAPTDAQRVTVLRVGVTRVSVGDGDGARVRMLWHALGAQDYDYWYPENDRAVLVRGSGAGASALTADDGTARLMPAVATDLGSPPLTDAGDAAEADYDLPFALRVGTRPDLVLDWGLDDGGAGAPRIRARVTGAHADDDAVGDQRPTTWRLDDAPTPNVGRYDLALPVRFEAERADHTWADFAGDTIPLRAYGILGDQTIASDDHSEPNAPWLAVVDAVAGWVARRTADPHAVAGYIVHGVNEQLALHYDTAMGASFYTTYGPLGFDGATFDLTSFLRRGHGSTVNCSDCASIVSTYANMVGCDLGYTILTQNFRLHFVRAIGTPSFTNDPFHRGMPGGFNYHAITSPIGDGTDVFDATLTEDGDDMPDAAPFLETAADGLARSFYLAHLSPAHLTVTHADKTTIE